MESVQSVTCAPLRHARIARRLVVLARRNRYFALQCAVFLQLCSPSSSRYISLAIGIRLARVRACVRTCMRACIRACMLLYVSNVSVYMYMYTYVYVPVHASAAVASL